MGERSVDRNLKTIQQLEGLNDSLLIGVADYEIVEFKREVANEREDEDPNEYGRSYIW